MGTETKKYQPEAGRADRLASNTIVLGAKQFPNPHNIHPMLDTESPSGGATRFSGGARLHKESAPAHMDISNPPAAQIIPSPLREQ